MVEAWVNRIYKPQEVINWPTVPVNVINLFSTIRGDREALVKMIAEKEQQVVAAAEAGQQLLTQNQALQDENQTLVATQEQRAEAQRTLEASQSTQQTLQAKYDQLKAQADELQAKNEMLQDQLKTRPLPTMPKATRPSVSRGGTLSQPQSGPDTRDATIAQLTQDLAAVKGNNVKLNQKNKEQADEIAQLVKDTEAAVARAEQLNKGPKSAGNPATADATLQRKVRELESERTTWQDDIERFRGQLAEQKEFNVAWKQQNQTLTQEVQNCKAQLVEAGQMERKIHCPVDLKLKSIASMLQELESTLLQAFK